MTRPDDHETDAIERLLANRSRHIPPPELRARVLAAAQKVPATKSGEHGGKESPRYPDLVAGTFWAALSLVLVVTLSSVVAWQRGGPSVDHPLLSFARRAEAAGITLDLDPPAAERLASAQPHDAAGPRRGDFLHGLDAHSLFKGEL
jgi:hypothetical protein